MPVTALLDLHLRPDALDEASATIAETLKDTRAFAGNRKLTAIYRKLIKELSLFRRLNLADGWLMPVSASEHPAIVKAIVEGRLPRGIGIRDLAELPASWTEQERALGLV